MIRTMPPLNAGGPVTATTAHQPQIDRLSSGAIRLLNNQSLQSSQVHRLLPSEVAIEADDPHPGWAITIRRGSCVRRHVFIATRSGADREADALAARRKWRRRR